MNVDVRYFAAAREAAGLEVEPLTLPAGSTVAALRELLFALHPDLRPLATGLRFAVGERFAGPDAALAEGDQVALIPPVSGG